MVRGHSAFELLEGKRFLIVRAHSDHHDYRAAREALPAPAQQLQLLLNKLTTVHERLSDLWPAYAEIRLNPYVSLNRFATLLDASSGNSYNEVTLRLREQASISEEK